MAYQKTMAIRDYLAFSLRSVITECIKKTMAIDCKKAMIAAGSRQDRDDRGTITTIAAGCSEMK